MIFNYPLVVGGLIATVITLAKTPSRKGPSGRFIDFFVTAAPGITLAQLLYAFAVRKWPILNAEPSVAPAFGLFLSSAGLPVFLMCREKLPNLLYNLSQTALRSLLSQAPGEKKP